MSKEKLHPAYKQLSDYQLLHLFGIYSNITEVAGPSYEGTIPDCIHGYLWNEIIRRGLEVSLDESEI